MRRTLWIALLGLAAVQAMAGGLWSTDFAKAAEDAKAGNRYLLLDFTGSDWCGFCMKLDDEVLGEKPFKQFAEEHLVCVVVDFPKQKALRKSLREQNDDLKKKYEVGGFPTILLLSPGGEIVEKKVGYTPGEGDAYLEDLKSSVAAHREKNEVPPPAAIQAKQPRVAGLPTSAAALPKGVPRDEDREMRAWKSRTGTSVQAALVEEKGPYVILRKEGGAQVQIATDGLSSEDQQYIASLRPRAAAAPASPEAEP